ncbi:MAG: tetratricopeptide repeat protein [Elusimicrobia bacterium]|nr:tetratricopeptide repeat protein [Elusimicrobiota bacterium]
MRTHSLPLLAACAAALCGCGVSMGPRASGDMARNLGAHDAALKYYTEYEAEESKYSPYIMIDAYLDMAESALGNGDAAQAHAYYVKAADNCEKDTDEGTLGRWKCCWKITSACSKNSDNEQLLRVARLFARSYPNDIDPRLQLGIALYRNKDNKGAIAELSKALALDAGGGGIRKYFGDYYITDGGPVTEKMAMSFLAYSYEALGDKAAALDAYQKLTEKYPDTMNLLGNFYNDANQFAKAYKILPGDSRLAMITGDYKNAIALTDKQISGNEHALLPFIVEAKGGKARITAIAERGRKPYVQGRGFPLFFPGLGEGILLAVNGKPVPAKTTAEATATITGLPTPSTAVFTVASGKEKWDVTVPMISAVPSDAYGIRALAKYFSGDLKGSAEDAREGLRQFPEDPWTQSAQSLALIGLGDYAAARKLLSGTDSKALARLILALAYAKDGKTDKAAEEYAKVDDAVANAEHLPCVALRKELSHYLRPLASKYMEQGNAALAQGRAEDAALAYSKATNIAGDAQAVLPLRAAMFKAAATARAPMTAEGRKHMLRAQVLVKEGDNPGAANELAQAVKASPYSADLYYNLAIVLGESREFARAIEAINAYLASEPPAQDRQAASDMAVKWEFMAEKEKK